jgi:hypothetical protein
MDRRALFFLGAAAICALLVPIADASHRWVAATTAVVYVVLAALSALDHASRTRAGVDADAELPSVDRVA